MILHDYDLVLDYYEMFDEAYVPRLFMLLNLIRCEVLNNYVDHFMKDKLLFIPSMIFKKCSIPFMWKNSDYLL